MSSKKLWYTFFMWSLKSSAICIWYLNSVNWCYTNSCMNSVMHIASCTSKRLYVWCFVWSEYLPQPSEELSRGPTCCTGKILYVPPLESTHYSICSEWIKPWTYVLYREEPVCATSRIHAIRHKDAFSYRVAGPTCCTGKTCMCHL